MSVCTWARPAPRRVCLRKKSRRAAPSLATPAALSVASSAATGSTAGAAFRAIKRHATAQIRWGFQPIRQHPAAIIQFIAVKLAANDSAPPSVPRPAFRLVFPDDLAGAIQLHD